MRSREQQEGVRYAIGETAVDAKLLSRLAGEARRSPRRRVRLCAHAGPKAKVHEMLIVMIKGGYLRPHRHHDKVESYHIISGRASVLEFDDRGRVRRIVPLGPAGSGRVFYFRNPARVYHMMLLETPIFAFHETTNGPFSKSGQEYAPWAPEEGDGPAVAEFLAKVRKETRARRTRS
jgi:cupin fold WbuC family metalloprotein